RSLVTLTAVFVLSSHRRRAAAVLIAATHSLFSFTATATPEIYTLSLHDALPICYSHQSTKSSTEKTRLALLSSPYFCLCSRWPRSEEHTSELQSRENLVCRLLLEKKKKTQHHQLSPPRQDDRHAHSVSTRHTGVP